ncbi:ComF family protein [Flexistipes sinusarabici]|uniref:ComF family protein n=1 Tax=Flexistipes sinusarabici TaxID=2352 RepID=UPI0026ED10E5|nr:phosphoribosyltransferase family protein [Flexistipes sinusarabici]
MNEIFYSECAGCDTKIEPGKYLCRQCLGALPLVVETCEACGYPLEVSASCCRNCSSSKFFDYLFIPFWYKGVIKEALKNLKFRYGYREINFLKYLTNFVECRAGDYDFITPVPSHFIRKFRRFIHPADIIASNIAEKYGKKKVEILKRRKYTKYQWQLKKNMRHVNVRKAFELRKEVKGSKILLVDDIMTTGNTLNECAKLLKSNGACIVDCLVLSKGIFV